MTEDSRSKRVFLRTLNLLAFLSWTAAGVVLLGYVEFTEPTPLHQGYPFMRFSDGIFLKLAAYLMWVAMLAPVMSLIGCAWQHALARMIGRIVNRLPA